MISGERCTVLAQVGPTLGAGVPLFWRRWDYRLGTCAAKRDHTHYSGAGLLLFSPPAPYTRRTCARDGPDGRCTTVWRRCSTVCTVLAQVGLQAGYLRRKTGPYALQWRRSSPLSPTCAICPKDLRQRWAGWSPFCRMGGYISGCWSQVKGEKGASRAGPLGVCLEVIERIPRRIRLYTVFHVVRKIRE